jgi:parallel beta-helix repeat protein
MKSMVLNKVKQMNIRNVLLLMVVFMSFSCGATYGATTLRSPADGATIYTTTPVLEWDEVTGATGYRLVLSEEDSTFGGLEDGGRADNTFCKDSSCQMVRISSSSYQVGPDIHLNLGKKYYWKVRDSVTTAWSSVSHFTLAPKLALPTLSNPSNGKQEVSISSQNYRWSSVQGATVYRIVVYQAGHSDDFIDDGGGSRCTDDTDGETCFTATTSSSNYNGFGLKEGKKYYWKIRAGSSKGIPDSGFTETDFFTTGTTGVDNNPPSSPEIKNIPAEIFINEEITFDVTVGTDPDGDQVKVHCAAENSSRAGSGYFESDFSSGGNTVEVSITFYSSGANTIYCTTFDENGAGTTAEKGITIAKAEPLDDSALRSFVIPKAPWYKLFKADQEITVIAALKQPNDNISSFTLPASFKSELFSSEKNIELKFTRMTDFLSYLTCQTSDNCYLATVSLDNNYIDSSEGSFDLKNEIFIIQSEQDKANYPNDGTDNLVDFGQYFMSEISKVLSEKEQISISRPLSWASATGDEEKRVPPATPEYFESGGFDTITISTTGSAQLNDFFFVENQADYLIYVGHGSSCTGSIQLWDSFDLTEIEEGYSPDNINEHWKKDLESAMIFGCAVLDINDCNGTYDEDYYRELGHRCPASDNPNPGMKWLEVEGVNSILGYNNIAPLVKPIKDGGNDGWSVLRTWINHWLRDDQSFEAAWRLTTDAEDKTDIEEVGGKIGAPPLYDPSYRNSGAALIDFSGRKYCFWDKDDPDSDGYRDWVCTSEYSEWKCDKAKLALSSPFPISTSGTIFEGQSINYSFESASIFSHLTVAVRWPGSDIDLRITTPNGDFLDPDSNLVLDSYDSGTHETYVIDASSIELGSWTIEVVGVEIDDEGEPYQLVIDADDGSQEQVDSDSDNMPNFWEYLYFGDLSHDATTDADNDGLNDFDEFQRGTDPNNPDSDYDGIPDGWEVLHGLDPLINDSGADADGDGFTNLEEYKAGTDPQDATSMPIQCATTVPDDFTRIQDAANYIAISDFGGNVCVQPGTYVEPKLKLKDGVYLVALSDDPAETIIDGNGKNDVITFQGVRVGGVIGFTLRNSKNRGNAAAIKVAGGKQMPLIARNIITDNKHGIRLQGNVRPLIINNTVTENSGDGISAGGNNPAMIMNNIVAFNQDDGIVGSGHNKVIIKGSKGSTKTTVTIKGSKKGSKGSNNSDLFTLAYNDAYGNKGGDYVRVDAGTGGISLDPRFSNGYQLASDSPCIDAGRSLDGTATDMGAYAGSTAALLKNAATAVLADTDQDGIDDAWELLFFGNLTTADATSDYDRDGYSDLQEYLNNLHRHVDPDGNAFDLTRKNKADGEGYEVVKEKKFNFIGIIINFLLRRDAEDEEKRP